jgi:hypothetical protein
MYRNGWFWRRDPGFLIGFLCGRCLFVDPDSAVWIKIAFGAAQVDGCRLVADRGNGTHIDRAMLVVDKAEAVPDRQISIAP